LLSLPRRSLLGLLGMTDDLRCHYLGHALAAGRQGCVLLAEGDADLRAIESTSGSWPWVSTRKISAVIWSPNLGVFAVSAGALGPRRGHVIWSGVHAIPK